MEIREFFCPRVGFVQERQKDARASMSLVCDTGWFCETTVWEGSAAERGTATFVVMAKTEDWPAGALRARNVATTMPRALAI